MCLYGVGIVVTKVHYCHQSAYIDDDEAALVISDNYSGWCRITGKKHGFIWDEHCCHQSAHKDDDAATLVIITMGGVGLRNKVLV